MLGTVILLYAFGFLNGREAERRQQTPASYSQAAKADAQRACAGSEATAVFECVYERVEASQEQARGEQDLSAQQRAATSALASAAIAFLTLVITGVGVWFVKRTLDATLEAVEDTSIATDAMREQNELARQNAVLQFRPYMGTLGAAVFNAFLQKPRIVIDIKNFGQTPARIIAQDLRVVHFARQQTSYQMKRIHYTIPLQATAHCDPGHSQSRSAIIDGPIHLVNGDHLFAEFTLTYKSFDDSVYWRRISYRFDQNSTRIDDRWRMDVHEVDAEDGEGKPPPSNLPEN